MSVAVIQGSSGGLGLALAKRILSTTGLKVVALTHRSNISDLRSELSSAATGDDRVSVIGGVDVREEESLEKAAKKVIEREGKGSVRLVACLAGILHPERSLSAIHAEKALDTFRINTLGHLLTYKHFVPLIPTHNELAKFRKAEANDPASGLIGSESSLCFSLSARVGSIADNEKGGWYSYRSSKAALNQIVRTLDHELVNKRSSAVAVGYHPGTVLTPFTRPVIGDKPPDPQNGLFGVEEAIDHMTALMGKASGGGDAGYGGRCYDWRGDQVDW